MATANVRINQILLRRGNTTAASAYTGPVGEAIVDTNLKTLRVQDGVTAGGTLLATNAQIQALGTYANATFGTSSFGNANVELYLNSQNITSANIGAFQTYANLTFSTQANAATQAVEINSLRANITAANAVIVSLTSNAAIQAAILDTLTGNAATQSTVLDTLTANAATQSSTLSDLLGNAVAQQTTLIDLVANAATQAEAIAAVTGTYSNTNVAAYLTAVTGNIIPSANVTYSLGSADRQWKDLWVSNNTIYIGNTPIRVDGGTLLVNNAPITAGSTYGNANVAAYLPTDPTFNDVGQAVIYLDDNKGNLINGSYTVSLGADGRLSAPGDVYGQYFTLRGGNGPGAEIGSLGYGGNVVTVHGFEGFNVNTGDPEIGPQWQFDTSGNLTVPGGAKITGSTYDIRLVAGNDGEAVAGTVSISTSNPAIGQSYNWQFNSLGELELPQGGLIKEGGGPFGSSITLEPANITDGDQVLVVYPTFAEGNHLHLTTGNLYNTEMYLGSDDYYVKLTNTGTILLNANDNAGAVSQWQFASSGNITLPNTGTIGEMPNPSGFPGYSILLQPSGYINPNQQLLVYPTGGADFNHLHLTSGDLYDTELFLGNDNLYVKLTNTGNVEIRADDSQGNTALWIFNKDSTTTFPNGLYFGPMGEVYMTGGTAGFGSTEYDVNIWANANGIAQQFNFGVDGTLTMPTGGNLIFDSSAVSVIDGVSSVITGNIITTNGVYWSNGAAYSTGGAGSYGNTEVASYLPTYTGNLSASRTQVTNSVDFMYGGYPYMGWQLTDSDTLKLRTNISSGDYTDDVILVNRQTLEVNVVAQLTAGNVITTNGIYWSNGAAYSSGSGNSYGNAQVAEYLANFDGVINFAASPATISTGEITAANVSSTNGFFWGNGTSILNGIASQSYVTTQINNLVNNAPALLDTLGEIAANLATEANATGSILSSIANTNANVVAANVNISALQTNAASQQTSIDTLLGRVDQAVNTTSSPQFAGLTTTANVELTANVHIHQNLVVDGNINFIGNVTQTNITTANAVFTGDTYGFGALYAGVLGYTPLPYTVIQATADYNDYSQINFQNLNLSANASTEWVATAGNGSDLTNYIDFGIAGGAWTGAQTNSVGTAAKANDGWLYVLGNTTAGTGGNLVLGTIQPGKQVNILTGGPGSANIYSYFNSAGLTTANVYATNYLYANGVSILSTVAPSSTYSNANVASYLVANPPTGTYSNTNVTALLSGNISTGNINIGSAFQLHGLDNSITTTNGSAIQFGQGVNFNSTTRIAVNGNILAQSGAASTSTGTGAIQVSGGVGVTGSIYAGGTVVATGNIVAANFNFANGVNILSTVAASSTYSNTNVSAYLTEQGITSANIGGSQTYANTQVQTINANLGAFQTYANTTFGVSSYGNTQVAAYLLTYPNVNASILNTTSGNITTLRAVNFNSANAVISGGYISALTNASIITGTVTTLNSTNGNVTTLVTTNFSTANAVITGGYATGLANITVTGNATVGNVIGVTPNVQLVAGAYTTSFLNNGMATIGGNISVSGNVTTTGIAPFYAPNRPAFRVYGNTSTVYTAGTTMSTQAIDYNQGGYYNNSTGIFTAPVPGLYHAYGTIRVANNNGLNQVTIVKNNTVSGANVVAFWETDTNTGTAVHFSLTGYAQMSAGDTLRLRVLTGNVQFDTNDSWGVTYIG